MDAKQRKQSGMEEEFIDKEKEQLLESLRGRFMEKDQKQAAKIKEKENREKGEKLRDDNNNNNNIFLFKLGEPLARGYY